MTTRTEAIVASAEVVSAVAVVVTLVILIASVRENTAVLRATAAAESRETLARMSDVDLMLGQPHFALLLRSQQPTVKPEDFSEVEMMHLTTAQRAFFRFHETKSELLLVGVAAQVGHVNRHAGEVAVGLHHVLFQGGVGHLGDIAPEPCSQCQEPLLVHLHFGLLHLASPGENSL